MTRTSVPSVDFDPAPAVPAVPARDGIAAIASGRQWLASAGNLDNLVRAAGSVDPDADRGRYFTDSDVYKWPDGRAVTPAPKEPSS
jgi:hypothetical protein